MTTQTVGDARPLDGVPAPGVDDEVGRDRPRWRERLAGVDPVLVVAGLLVLLPTVAAMISALRHPWAPTNDWALLELEVRRVGTADTPLLGAWSRFGWRHPGPLPFYLLALPYRLVPAAHGLLFGAGFVNFLATAGCVAVAVRHPRMRALVLLGGVAILERGLGVAQLGDPWNPTLPVVPFVLFVLLCLELALAPRRWTLAAVVGVASFVVQAHVGFAQPVVVIGAVALALRWREVRRVPWRRLVAPGVVAALCWLPVAIDQVFRTGNFGMIVRWSLGRDVAPGMGHLTEGRLPFDRAAQGTAWLLDPTGLWLGHFRPVFAFGFELLGLRPAVLTLWIVVVLAAVAVAVRRLPMAGGYRRATAGAGVLAGAGFVAAVADVLTARGAPVFWPFRWVAVVPMMVFVTVGWAVAGVAARRVPALDAPLARPVRRVPVLLAGGALAVLALPVAATVWGGSLGAQPKQAASAALLRLAPALDRHAGGEAPVVANSTDMFNDVDLGVAVLLERDGIPWVQRGTAEAAGRPGYTVVRADALDGLMGLSLAAGKAEVVARSGRPGPGEAPDSELVLIRTDPQPPAPAP